MELDEFLENLNNLVNGNLDEDSTVEILEKLKADKEVSLNVKHQKISDFFARNDTKNQSVSSVNSSVSEPLENNNDDNVPEEKLEFSDLFETEEV